MACDGHNSTQMCDNNHVTMGGVLCDNEHVMYLGQVVSQTSTSDIGGVEPQECGHCLCIAVCTNAK